MGVGLKALECGTNPVAVFQSAPTPTAAAIVNPIIIGTLVTFNGAFIPYSQITAFWRYWLCEWNAGYLLNLQ